MNYVRETYKPAELAEVIAVLQECLTRPKAPSVLLALAERGYRIIKTGKN